MVMSLTDDVTASMTDNPATWDPHPTASPSLSEVAAPTLDSTRTNPSPPSHLGPPPDPPLLLPSPLEAVVMAAAAATVAERAQSPWGAESGVLAAIGGSGGSTRASQQSDGGGRTTQQQGGGVAGQGQQQQQHSPEAGSGREPVEPIKASKNSRARSKERRDGRSTSCGTSSRKRGDSAPRSPSRSSRPCHTDSSLNGGTPASASALAPGTIPPDAPVSQQGEPLMTHKAQPPREAERGGKEGRGSHHATKSSGTSGRKATVSPGPWKIPGSDKLPSTLRSGSSTVSR